MRLRTSLLLTALMFLVLNTALAAPELFTVGESSVIELDIPDQWSSTPQDADAEGGIAIRIEPPGKLPLILFVTPLIADATITDVAHHVKTVAEETAARLQEVAVEDNLRPKVLKGPHCQGLYVSATDRTVEHPSLEDFKYMDQGLVAFGDFLMTFTILTNVNDAPERVEALDIVRSARQFGSSHSNQSLGLLSLSSVHLRPKDLPDDCELIDGEYAVSIQARTFYSMKEQLSFLGGDIVDRSHQSIQCGRNRATVYYYQYESEAETLSALPSLKTFIWGEDSPSRMHPERFVIINNVIAVVSGKKPKRFVSLVEARRRAG